MTQDEGLCDHGRSKLPKSLDLFGIRRKMFSWRLMSDFTSEHLFPIRSDLLQRADLPHTAAANRDQPCLLESLVLLTFPASTNQAHSTRVKDETLSLLPGPYLPYKKLSFQGPDNPYKHYTPFLHESLIQKGAWLSFPFFIKTQRCESLPLWREASPISKGRLENYR